MEKVRCNGCRGAKKVPKLGGMIGECNVCAGKGVIDACDKHVPVIAEPATTQSEVKAVVSQVSDVQPHVEVARIKKAYEKPTIKKMKRG